MPRFNHMELTVPRGQLTRDRKQIAEFFQDMFGFESRDVDILKQTGLLICTDPEVSQFILVTEQRVHLDSPGFDHLGFLYESRAEVDALLEKAKKWRERDARVQIKEYEDLKSPGVTTHAFYVRYLLPLWFDVQCLEYKPGAAPRRTWKFD
jgi:hypothetical protein